MLVARTYIGHTTPVGRQLEEISNPRLTNSKMFRIAGEKASGDKQREKQLRFNGGR